MAKTAVAAAGRPTWQDCIDALRKAGSRAEAEYLEWLREGARDRRLSTEELAARIRPL